MANLFESVFFGNFAKLRPEFIVVPGQGVEPAGGQVANVHVLGHAIDVRIKAAIIRCDGKVSSNKLRN